MDKFVVICVKNNIVKSYFVSSRLLVFNIKVLDCTLRDGGYVNNWEFGLTSSQKFLKNIDEARIEYVEIGFLKDSEYNQEKTVFNEIEQIKRRLNM